MLSNGVGRRGLGFLEIGASFNFFLSDNASCNGVPVHMFSISLDGRLELGMAKSEVFRFVNVFYDNFRFFLSLVEKCSFRLMFGSHLSMFEAVLD